jgi:hypothetical protein
VRLTRYGAIAIAIILRYRDAIAEPRHDHCCTVYRTVPGGLADWRTITITLGCALLIGGVGGLIGLGGGEFRLPLLVGLIGFTARSAVH